MSSPVFIAGVPADHKEALPDAIRRVFLDAANQLSWLHEGDTVLLKPALNSPGPYPATTHPLSVSVIRNILMERGARVIVGDQSGIEHVLHAPSGVIKGSSKKNFETAGMGSADEFEFVGFENGGWDAGFRHFKSPEASSWKNGFFITTVLDAVDHVISLPRVSTHAQAGATLGFKNLVGLLREDSRLEFHANGPFNEFIMRAAKGSGLESQNDGQQLFIEKIVEVMLAVREKLRLTLFTATQIQTTLGPDRSVVGIQSHVVTPEIGLVFASPDPVAAECFALAFLTHLHDTRTPRFSKFLQHILIRANGRIKELESQTVLEHPYITHATKLGLGSIDIDARYTDVPERMRSEIEKWIHSPAN